MSGGGERALSVQSGRRDDTTLDDFARLFAPGAALDGFMNTLLRRSSIPQARRGGAPVAATAPVSPADLAQFQRAAAIRDAFFADGGTADFRLDIAPVSSMRRQQVTLDLDGTAIVYTRGVPRDPGDVAESPHDSARLVFEPPPSTAPPVCRHRAMGAVPLVQPWDVCSSRERRIATG